MSNMSINHVGEGQRRKMRKWNVQALALKNKIKKVHLHVLEEYGIIETYIDIETRKNREDQYDYQLFLKYGE